MENINSNISKTKLAISNENQQIITKIFNQTDIKI